jgi:hypothetical protein
MLELLHWCSPLLMVCALSDHSRRAVCGELTKPLHTGHLRSERHKMLGPVQTRCVLAAPLPPVPPFGPATLGGTAASALTCHFAQTWYFILN